MTAGNTREMIDRVRDWGNVFTGNTGYAIATELAATGAEVDLLTSNRAHLAAADDASRGAGGGVVRPSGFTSHAELKAALASLTTRNRYDAVFMTAAVADYRPAGVYELLERRQGDLGAEVWVVRDAQAAKVKSSYGEIAVLGRPTEKLVDLFRSQWGHRGLLVKFKLEVDVPRERLIDVGRASRLASGADYLVANTLDMTSGAGAGAYLLGEQTEEWVPRGDLPRRLAALVNDHLASAGRTRRT